MVLRRWERTESWRKVNLSRDFGQALRRCPRVQNMYSFLETLAWWTVPSEERGAHQGCDEEARFLDHFHYLFVIRICVS